MAKSTIAGISIWLALAMHAAAWTDVWGTNATPRGMLSNVTAWVVLGELTNITATATNITRYWTHISPVSNHVRHVQTNAVLDAKQRREYEAVISMRELLGDRYSTPFFRTVYWYRSIPTEDSGGEPTVVDTLENLKSAWTQAHADAAKRAHVDALLSAALGDSVATGYGGIGGPPLVLATNPASLWVRESVAITQTLAYIGLPTNWLAWSPVRNRHGWGRAIDSTSAVSYIISTTNAGPVTNAVWDAFGVATNIVGTNGQVVTVSPVASPIVPGFDSHDYGYKHIPRAFNAVSWPHLSVSGGLDGWGVTASDTATNSYAATVASAESQYATNLSASAGLIEFTRFAATDEFGLTGWRATIRGTDQVYFDWGANALALSHGTGLASSTGRVYAIGAALLPYDSATRVEFDAQGSAITGTNTLHMIYAGESAPTATNIVADLSIFNGGAIPPNQPAEPASGESEVRGWVMYHSTAAAFLIPTNYYTFIEPYADVTP